MPRSGSFIPPQTESSTIPKATNVVGSNGKRLR
jgi:hypothetical protein